MHEYLDQAVGARMPHLLPTLRADLGGQLPSFAVRSIAMYMQDKQQSSGKFQLGTLFSGVEADYIPHITYLILQDVNGKEHMVHHVIGGWAADNQPTIPRCKCGIAIVLW